MTRAAVLLPVYNAEKYLSEAIGSLLNQTFRDFNVYIVNDGSTDDSENIILSFNDPRIKYIKKERNSGITDTLNAGLSHVKEEFVIRMDADDRCLPDRFRKLVEYMDQNPETVICGS